MACAGRFQLLFALFLMHGCAHRPNDKAKKKASLVQSAQEVALVLSTKENPKETKGNSDDTMQSTDEEDKDNKHQTVAVPGQTEVQSTEKEDNGSKSQTVEDPEQTEGSSFTEEQNTSSDTKDKEELSTKEENTSDGTQDNDDPVLQREDSGQEDSDSDERLNQNDGISEEEVNNDDQTADKVQYSEDEVFDGNTLPDLFGESQSTKESMESQESAHMKIFTGTHARELSFRTHALGLQIEKLGQNLSSHVEKGINKKGADALESCKEYQKRLKNLDHGLTEFTVGVNNFRKGTGESHHKKTVLIRQTMTDGLKGDANSLMERMNSEAEPKARCLLPDKIMTPQQNDFNVKWALEKLANVRKHRGASIQEDADKTYADIIYHHDTLPAGLERSEVIDAGQILCANHLEGMTRYLQSQTTTLDDSEGKWLRSVDGFNICTKDVPYPWNHPDNFNKIMSNIAEEARKNPASQIPHYVTPPNVFGYITVAAWGVAIMKYDKEEWEGMGSEYCP